MPLDFKSSDKPSDEDRVHIFSIDDTKYYVNTKPRANVALRFMHLSRTQGDDAAMDYMLGAVLGEEAHEALMNWDELTQENLTAVFEELQRIVLGETEENLQKKS